MVKHFPVIDPVATGENILRLRKAKGLSVRDLQAWFGFDEPQAIYKWQKGKSLPTVDNLYALGALLEVPMEEILVPSVPKLNTGNHGQQGSTCCPSPLFGGCGYGRGVGRIFRYQSSIPKSIEPFFKQFKEPMFVFLHGCADTQVLFWAPSFIGDAEISLRRIFIHQGQAVDHFPENGFPFLIGDLTGIAMVVFQQILQHGL